MQDKVGPILRKIEKLIPRKLYKLGQPYYHFLLAALGNIIYKFPSREIKVIGVTGTKGKSSTCEYINAVLEGAGHKTSLLSTIRFKVGETSVNNLFKMTMPGRFFLQKFLRDSVNAGCEYAVVEITSEGSRYYRHLWLQLDVLVVTNITEEHIESHGSYHNYLQAKLNIARQLSKSKKNDKFLVISNENDDLQKFQQYKGHKSLVVDTNPKGLENIHISLPGEFNKANAKLALRVATQLGLDKSVSEASVKNLSNIPGRAEEISIAHAQHFKLVIDYAHTVHSLEKIYSTYPGKIVAVLGACGGGRDKAKQPLLGTTAEAHADVIILTDEDPYDDDVMEIIENVKRGIKNKVENKNLFIEADRRKAIQLAIKKADELSRICHDVSVIITGKGTDPYIMRAGGQKEKWSDKVVATEELKKYFNI